MSNMSPDPHSLSIDEVRRMSEEQWLNTVRKHAFPERAQTMAHAVQLAKERGVKRIIETGCFRGLAGDGQSTLILSMLAVRLNASFSTFDISHIHVQKARLFLGPFADTMEWNIQDSVIGLSRLQGDVGLVYLDSFDYSTLNPRPCQLHQLAEIGAIYGKLTDDSILMMDDATLDGGGKVAMASDFLINNGWKKNMEGYQLIFTRQ